VVVDKVFRVERLIPFIRSLLAAGIGRVVFAGAAHRPRLDPALFDPLTVQLLPRMMAAMQGGDDQTLRFVVDLFGEEGLEVLGVPDVAPALVPAAGVLAGAVAGVDDRDASRAAAIVAALGTVDVGQAAVVQQGMCLAAEALPGTDAMLGGVATLPATLRPDPARGRGLLYKAPKPGQDLRTDLPTLGPETVAGVAAAGLGGIAWQAGGVICLDLPAMVAGARTHGLFLWARGP